MEAIAGLGAFVAMMLAFGAGFFLFVVQPIWSIVDVATCERLSKGAKAVIIVLTLILLGPIMTIGYALFGTHSRGLRKTTLVGAALFLLSVASVFGLTAIGSTGSPSSPELPGSNGFRDSAQVQTPTADLATAVGDE